MSRVRRIQILHVPDCANVDRVRETVRRALGRARIPAEVEELVGAYPSPTLLIDGVDVTGRAPEMCTCCRLDLPTEEQVLAALGAAGSLEEEIRKAAFRRLLGLAAPARVADVAADLGRPLQEVRRAAADLAARGRLQVDDQGRIAGSAGLSVQPDRHTIDLAERRFWTWCAYDILGIFGALGAGGFASSPNPLGGQPLKVAFEQGRPRSDDLVLFLPGGGGKDSCKNVYEEWCPNSNFFESRDAALRWAADQGLPGNVLTLAEASELATADWERLVAGLRL
ncbi:MAG: hypothetical protein J2P28_23780 [Actinobacteria bacterium]|nr:hypothetical protein [Actinomycetota bacterium]